MSIVWTYIVSAWRWILGSKAAQVAIGIAGLVSYHLFAKWNAARKAVKEEREEAREKAREKRAEMEGDIHAARQKLEQEQEERRERESDEDPRDRFGRDPFQ